MNEEFYQAHLPDERIVLGLSLRPLSLGHLIILRRLGSPFIDGSETDLGDLALAALVCHQTYEDAESSLKDIDRELFMRKWAASVTGRNKWLVKLGLRDPTELDVAGESLVFVEYLTENITGPQFTYDGESSSSIACPAEQIVKISLMRDLHFTESQILNRSWRLCLWDFITLRTLAGQVTMVDREAMAEAYEIGRTLSEMVKEGKLNGFHIKNPS